MLQLYDRFTDLAAWLAAWLYVAAGAMLGYEVAARYLFTAPTIWAEELSRFCLVWGTFLAAAALLAKRQHIRIGLVVDRLPMAFRRVAEALSLGFVALLSAVIVWHGSGIAFDSFERGRTAGTMLDLPMWWGEAAAPVGFAMLGVQAVIELAKLARGAPLPATDHGES
ncbi:MAG: TRAP transporter small permease [Pseudomonadota bacterium]